MENQTAEKQVRQKQISLRNPVEPKKHLLKKTKKNKESCELKKKQGELLSNEVLQLKNEIQLYRNDNNILKQEMLQQRELLKKKLNEMEFKEQYLTKFKVSSKMMVFFQKMNEMRREDAEKVENMKQKNLQMYNILKSNLKFKEQAKQILGKQLMAKEKWEERYKIKEKEFKEQIKTLAKKNLCIQKLQKINQKQANQLELIKGEHVKQLKNQKLMYENHIKNLQAKLQNLTGSK